MPCDGKKECLTEITRQHRTISITQWNNIKQESVAKDADALHVPISNLTSLSALISKGEMCKSGMANLIRDGILFRITNLYSNSTVMNTYLLDDCSQFQ